MIDLEVLRQTPQKVTSDGHVFRGRTPRSIICPQQLSPKRLELILDTIEDATEFNRVGDRRAVTDFMGHAQSFVIPGFLRRTTTAG